MKARSEKWCHSSRVETEKSVTYERARYWFWGIRICHFCLSVRAWWSSKHDKAIFPTVMFRVSVSLNDKKQKKKTDTPTEIQSADEKPSCGSSRSIISATSATRYTASLRTVSAGFLTMWACSKSPPIPILNLLLPFPSLSFPSLPFLSFPVPRGKKKTGGLTHP